MTSSPALSDHAIPRREFLQSSFAAAIAWQALLPQVLANDTRSPLLNAKLRDLIPRQGRVTIDPFNSTFTGFALFPRDAKRPFELAEVNVTAKIHGERYVISLSVVADSRQIPDTLSTA